MKSQEEKANKSLTVKDFSLEDQPREKALKKGCGALTTSELWALILRTGTPGTPITELCKELMKSNNDSLHKLERRSMHQLMELKGIGTTKCIQILAVLELIKRYCNEELPDDTPITSPYQIFDRMKITIGNLDHEEIWVLYLNRRNQILKEMRITTGTSVSSIFDVKMIIKHALLENAESMVLCHNHPSGSIKASLQDDNITKELSNACRLMNLKLLDHVIVTADKYYSYRDSGKL